MRGRSGILDGVVGSDVALFKSRDNLEAADLRGAGDGDVLLEEFRFLSRSVGSL
jgi:hypothetical protein